MTAAAATLASPEPQPAPTGAELVAAALAGAGCRHAFGIPGGEVLAVVDALDRAGVAFHLVRHENPGGFMAEGTWHAIGAPAVLVATIGPGVANAINVVANAQQDRVPLIFVTGCLDGHEAETYTHQVFDHQAVLRPLVKASFRLTRGAVGVAMEKAIALALDGQPGPVHLDLPIGVAEHPCPEPPRPERRDRSLAPAPAAEALEAMAEALALAQRPLILTGVDAVNAMAGRAVTALAHRLGAPVIASYKAKGLLDEADPLALGGAGLSPAADQHLLPLIRAADVVLLAGYDPIEMRVNWREPFAAATQVLELTPVRRSHGMHQADLSAIGAVRAGLEGVLMRLERMPAAAPVVWPGGEPAAVRAALARRFAPEPVWGPARVIHTLRQVLPADTVATADSGAHRILLSQIWTCRHPRGLLQSSALCTMGCAVPLAAGYALARGGEAPPVVAFIGDAGLEMILGELATLRDLGLPVIIVVFVDTALALIALKQKSQNRPPVGVHLGRSDFAGVARAMGGEGVDVTSEAELREAAAQALSRRDRFTVIAAHIARDAYEGRL